MHAAIYAMNTTLHMREYLAHLRAEADRLTRPAPVPEPAPVKASVITAALRTTDPIVETWRNANPKAHRPNWYTTLETYCRENRGAAWTACSLFVQLADEPRETNTTKLLHLVRKAIRIAGGDSIVESEPFQNAIAAMRDVDFLAKEGHRPEMAAALALEEKTLTDLDRYIGEMEL